MFNLRFPWFGGKLQAREHGGLVEVSLLSGEASPAGASVRTSLPGAVTSQDGIIYCGGKVLTSRVLWSV